MVKGKKMEEYLFERNIFENEPIDFEDIDFQAWLTEDGEWMDIEELTDDEVMGAVYTLKRKLRLLPEHVNSDIWEEYLAVMSEEAAHRGLR